MDIVSFLLLALGLVGVLYGVSAAFGGSALYAGISGVVGLVGVAAGYSSIVLFAVLYIPAVLATAFVVGPSQTSALSHLDRETSAHGVTIVSTSFQIAGCVGTSLAAGLYGALTAANITAGRGEFDSLLTGFHGAVALVVAVSVIGIILAFLAHRSTRARTPGIREPARAEDVDGTVESFMRPDVYALSTDQTVLAALQTFSERGISGAPVLNADNTAAGFLSDGDVVRYLSATAPSSTSIYSFAVDDDLTKAMAELGSVNVMRLATHDVRTIERNASVADAVAALSDARIKKIPVVDPGTGVVVGVVNLSAINRLAVEHYLRNSDAAITSTR